MPELWHTAATPPAELPSILALHQILVELPGAKLAAVSVSSRCSALSEKSTVSP